MESISLLEVGLILLITAYFLLFTHSTLISSLQLVLIEGLLDLSNLNLGSDAFGESAKLSDELVFVIERSRLLLPQP